jgi:hypothetical protein
MMADHPTWLKTVAAVPAAVMLWILLAWNPEGRRQWRIAIVMMLYIAAYYWFFVHNQ